jgi:hypothetical protein
MKLLTKDQIKDIVIIALAFTTVMVLTFNHIAIKVINYQLYKLDYMDYMLNRQVDLTIKLLNDKYGHKR